MLKKIHKKIKEINGLPVVNIRWVREYLGEKRFFRFQSRYGSKFYKKYESCSCSTCGDRHLDKRKFTTWIYFWHIEEFFNQGELPFREIKIEETKQRIKEDLENTNINHVVNMMRKVRKKK